MLLLIVIAETAAFFAMGSVWPPGHREPRVCVTGRRLSVTRTAAGTQTYPSMGGTEWAQTLGGARESRMIRVAGRTMSARSVSPLIWRSNRSAAALPIS